MERNGATIRGVMIAAALLAAVGGCRGKDLATERLADGLEACDYGEACAKLVVEVRKLSPDIAASPAGVRARLAALHAELNALVDLAPGDDGFLASTGRKGDAAAQLAAEVDLLAKEGLPGTADAKAILAFWREKSCGNFGALEPIASGQGRFADSAALARLTSLGTIFAGAQAVRVALFVEMARSLVGCNLSERAQLGAVFVDAHNRFLDLVDACDDDRIKDVAWKASCAEAATIAATPVPLPYPSAESGEMLGALVPPALREAGIAFTPPWMIVLSAGRVGVVDQPSLAAGVRQMPDVRTTPVIDLRERRKPDDLAGVLARELKQRKPHDVGPVKVLPLLVDRGATFQDLSELLEALVAVSDATPVAAVLPPRARSPLWVPLNWRLPTRVLLDATGERRAGGNAPDVRGSLGPFQAVLAPESPEAIAHNVTLGGDPSRGDRPDLRALYKAALALAGDRTDATTWLAVEPNVQVGLLLTVLQAIAYRVADPQLNSPAGFEAAAPLRARGGGYQFALATVVLKLP